MGYVAEFGAEVARQHDSGPGFGGAFAGGHVSRHGSRLRRSACRAAKAGDGEDGSSELPQATAHKLLAGGPFVRGRISLGGSDCPRKPAGECLNDFPKQAADDLEAEALQRTTWEPSPA